MGMRCSVVIPCFNGAELTASCIESLLEQTGGHELEILLVDNASTDGTARLGAQHPTVRVLRQATNRGFAGGVNAGLRAARHPLLLILNNDTRAAPNLLTELHRQLTSDPRIGAVAPVSNHVKGPALLPIGSAGRERQPRARLAEDLSATDTPQQDVDNLAGLCLLMRRSTLDEVGLFDERFGHGNFEDDDLCLRLRLAGYRLVIARTAFLHHEGHATFRAMGIPLTEEIARRRVQFEAKWQHDPAGRAVIAALHGDLLAAAAAAAKARAVWPKWPDADWHLARGRSLAGDAMGAAHHFATLLRGCPRHSDAALELGLHLLAAGQTTTAQHQLGWTIANCHLSHNQQLHLLHVLGERAYHEQRWPEAVENFRAAVALAPDDGALHNWLGTALLGIGDPSAAIASFTRAIELDFALAYTNRGIASHRLGAIFDALADFRTARQRLPNDPTARDNLAALEAHLATTQLAASTARSRTTRAPAPAAGTGIANATNSSTIDSIEAFGTQPIA
jgi:GT2 family glycosyltransferase/Tfp pilus assembly protein PilF